MVIQRRSPLAWHNTTSHSPLAGQDQNQYDVPMWQQVNKVPNLTVFQKRQPHIFLTLLLGVIFVGWRLLAPAQALAQQTITFDDYLRLIGRANNQVQSAIGQPPAQCRVILGEVAGALTAVTHVQLPDDSIMPVNHAGADQILRASPCNPQQALTYLTGICPLRVCPINSQPADEPIPPDSFNQPTTPPENSSETSAAPGSTQGSTPGSSSGTSADGSLQAQPPESAPNAAESVPETTGVDTAVSPNNSQTGTTNAPTGTDENAAGDNAPGGEGIGQSGETAVDAAPNEGQPGPGETTNNPTAATAAGSAGDGPTAPSPNNSAESQTTEAVSQEAESAGTAVSDPISPATEPAKPENPVTDNRSRAILIALILLIVLALALVGFLLWRQWQAQEAARRKQRQNKPASSSAAIEEGRRQIKEENYREAVRRLFLATLLALEERGILQYDRTLTNYELLQKMQTNPGILTTLHAVVGTVERVWYGFEPLAVIDYEALVTEINALRVAQEK